MKLIKRRRCICCHDHFPYYKLEWTVVQWNWEWGICRRCYTAVPKGVLMQKIAKALE